LGRFEFFRKSAEIFAKKYLLPVSLIFGEKFIAGVKTPAINPRHEEITKRPKIFAGVNDTANKLYDGVNDAGD
jgi:hypothetical protein